MDDLDNVMDVIDSMEARNKAASQPAARGRVEIGKVERFFDKLNVVAIRLTGELAVGDAIEIENEDYAVRQKVGSMQINRKDIVKAVSGDDVGIKLKVPVREGSSVYRLD